MGGRAAETLLFDGDISTGAADDLQRATEIALEMVTRYGMAEVIGPRTYKAPTPAFLGVQEIDKPVASEATLREIDLAVHDIVQVALAEAKNILERRRQDLDKGAELLLTKEAITPEEFPPLRKSSPGAPAALPVAADGPNQSTSVTISDERPKTDRLNAPPRRAPAREWP